MLQVGYDTNAWTDAQPRRYEGASSYIALQGGYVLCTTDTNGASNFSTSWAMVFGANGDGYAQSGTMYRWGYGSCVRYWAEQEDTNGFWGDYYLGNCAPQTGEVHKFWEQSYYTGSAWVMRSNVDTTIIRQSSFSPFSWTSPFGVAFNGETHHSQSHVPGTNAHRQEYTAMGVQDYNDNQFYDSCGNVNLGQRNMNAPRWGVVAVSCRQIQYWTN